MSKKIVKAWAIIFKSNGEFWSAHCDEIDAKHELQQMVKRKNLIIIPCEIHYKVTPLIKDK